MVVFQRFPLDIANLIANHHFSYLDHNFRGEIGAISLQGEAWKEDKSIGVTFSTRNYVKSTSLC